MTSHDAIEHRTNGVVGTTTDEIVLVIGDESLLTSELAAVLREGGNGVDLVTGALTASLQDRLQETIPNTMAE